MKSSTWNRILDKFASRPLSLSSQTLKHVQSLYSPSKVIADSNE